MAKLSPVQQEVINLMANGWELNIIFNAWVQIQKGSETKGVNLNAFRALLKRGLVQVLEESFLIEKCGLTEAGKAQAERG